MSQDHLSKVATHAPKSALMQSESSSAERARILLALIDQQETKNGLGALTEEAKAVQSKEDPQGTQDLPSRETLLKSARDLLSRLEPTARTQTKMRPTQTPQNLKLPRSILRSTIAALIGESDLRKEHPAVIAIVLGNQDAKTKAAVLRQLPGPIARRVQRAMELVKGPA